MERLVLTSLLAILLSVPIWGQQQAVAPQAPVGCSSCSAWFLAKFICVKKTEVCQPKLALVGPSLPCAFACIMFRNGFQMRGGSLLAYDARDPDIVKNS